MTLYLRMLLVVLKLLFGKRGTLREESAVRFRAWPLDCDLNLHLTGARYVALADLGRIHLIGQVGILEDLLLKRWFPVANSVEVSYLRPIEPFERFTLHSRLVTWDDKHWHVEQRFEAGGKLRARALVTGVFLCKGRVVPVPDVLALTGETPSPPDRPDETRSGREEARSDQA